MDIVADEKNLIINPYSIVWIDLGVTKIEFVEMIV